MAAFLGNISFLLDLAMIGSALIVLHFAKKESSGCLKGAGYFLLISGIVLALCTGYYGMKYHFQGDFDRAYFKKPRHSRPWERGEKVRRHHKGKHDKEGKEHRERP